MIEVNELQKRRVDRQAHASTSARWSGKRVALLGLAFKPDTDDMREASSLVLAARLRGRGGGVAAYDPVAERRPRELLPTVEMCGLGRGGARGADAAVLVTEWPEFAELDWDGAAQADGAGRCSSTGATSSTPSALRGGRLRRTRASAGPRRGRRQRPERDRAPDAGARPGRRRGDPPAAAHAHACRSRRCRWSTGRSSPTWSTGWPATASTRSSSPAASCPTSCARRSATAERGGPRIRYVEEPEPLGTAGAIRFAAELGLLGDRFLALNGDVLTDLDLTALMGAHEERGARATLGLYPVEDSAAYGLVRRDEDGEVLEFLEKPTRARSTPDEINAGVYVLERAVLDLIPPGRAVSIEREVFPRLVGQGLYGLRLEGYWMDIGTPERYLQASWDILERRVETDAGPTDGAGIWSRTGAERRARAPAVGPRGGDVGAGACRGRGRSGARSTRARSCSTAAGSAPGPRSAARSSPPGSRSVRARDRPAR